MSAAAKFGVWTTPRTTTEIEYSLVVLEEIRRAVLDGIQNVAKGMEVGGLLFGTVGGGRLRIEAMRDIACEHAYGPAFQLSDGDKSSLAAQLENIRLDPSLGGLQPVGWFVSHPRRDLALLPTDVELFNQFFPDANCVTLAIRPGRAGNMRAGFFLREADGTLKTDRSYLDFSFPDPSPNPSPNQGPTAVPPATQPRRNNAERSSIPIDRSWEVDPFPASTPAPLRSAPNETRSFGEPPPEKIARTDSERGAPTRTIAWIAAGALALVLAAIAIPKFAGTKTAPDPLALSVLDQNGQLSIRWNHTSKTISSAVYGALEIVDGEDHMTFSLNPQELAQGNYTYARRTGDIQVRMSVSSAAGQKTQEASRFLGVPPSSSGTSDNATGTAASPAVVQASPAPASPDAAAEQAENARLKARIQQLERTVVILQGRLGIDQEK